jgi:pentapeptide repeat protein
MITVRHRETGEPLFESAGDTLAGAELAGAVLLYADLHGADLRGANLRGADLCQADLRNATFGGGCHARQPGGRELPERDPDREGRRLPPAGAERSNGLLGEGGGSAAREHQEQQHDRRASHQPFLREVT